MRKVIVFVSVTLDGVMQAPARPDEDVRGGFTHGGWAIPYADEVMGRVAGESMAGTGAIILGRRTYEDFYSVWPNRKDNPYTEVLNNSLKCVASRTLKEPLPWMNSKLLEGDAADAVARLKEQPGKDMVVLGSGELVQSLMRKNVVDEFVLQTHPLVLGSGRRLFDGGGATPLRLVDTTTTSKGVVIATYRPAAA
ncbi:MAG TPA: dihydrofolate reductase family protein [Candidatus Acidoferrum sp.]|nr:dihydrofolate reductase family protein [Candidatus Acidoferrum sp.]